MIMLALNLSIIEIIILQLGAVILGAAIHFFLASRRNLKSSGTETQKIQRAMEDWKLKYFNEAEQKEKELNTLKKQLAESEEDRNINTIEAEELRKQNKTLKTEIERLQKTSPQAETRDYITQLKQAQQSLVEHHEIINQLLGQVDKIKENEEKHRELLMQNEELSGQVSNLKSSMTQKEKELSVIKQKETVTSEMISRLDNAYTEFNILQEKIQKLESDAVSAKMVNLELADLKETHYKLQKDFDDQKLKLNSLTAESQNLRTELNETEEKLKEANFQKQQLQKRVVYLEELNNDFHLVSEANKKLETQIKKIGELESMLNVVMEERDDLARKQTNPE
jgi:chromosome segregation ATPase